MRTLLILVDALRHDWVTPASMPFTAGLASRGVTRTIRDTFGFAGIRAAIFHGLEPRDSGMVFLYQLARAPGESPFRWLRRLPGGVTRLLGPRALRRVQRLWNAWRRRVDPLAIPVWDFSAIPLDLLGRFRFGEPYSPLDPRYLPGRPSVFDALDRRSIVYLGYPGCDQRTDALLDRLRAEVSRQTRLAYLHFAELDWEQHRSGPESERVETVRRRIDDAIAETCAACESAWSEPFRVIVFGDHGAVAVERTVDIEGLLGLDSRDPASRRGIVYFVDSTMARFWFEDSEREREIRDALAGLDAGRVVEADELPSFGCAYDRSIFGDLFYCLDQGRMFFPNFFHRESPPTGMHGYLPGAEDDDGALVMAVHGGGAALDDREAPVLPDRLLEMTDLYHLLAERELESVT